MNTIATDEYAKAEILQFLKRTMGERSSISYELVYNDDLTFEVILKDNHYHTDKKLLSY